MSASENYKKFSFIFWTLQNKDTMNANQTIDYFIIHWITPTPLNVLNMTIVFNEYYILEIDQL